MKRKTTREYIAILPQIVGNPERGYSTAYNWDLERFSTPKRAIRHGFKVRGSDDFNIGVIENERVVEIRWMDEVHPPEESDLDEVNDQLGFR